MPANPAYTMTIFHAPGAVGAPQVVVVAPTLWDPLFFTPALPAPAAFENTGLSQGHRAYSRVAKINALGDSTNVYAWQGQYIFGATPGGWAVVHGPLPSMSTATDYGVHTGLYTVQSEDGLKPYLCGIYLGATGLFYVTLDVETGVWSSGAIPGAAAGAGTTFSTCVEFKGKLVTAYSGDLISFDPATNTAILSSYSAQAAALGSGATQYDKVHVTRGRLFLVAAGAGTFALLEPFGNSPSGVTAIFDHALSFGSGGDFTIGDIDQNSMWIIAYSTTGGTGIKATRILVQSDPPTLPGLGIVLEDKTATVVDPVLAWPSSLENSSGTAIWFTTDNSYSPKGAAAGWMKLTNYGSSSTMFDRIYARNIEWHFTFPWSYVPAPGAPQPVQPNGYDKVYAYPLSQYGTMEYLLPEASAQILSVEPYADGTVSGMLVRFFTHAGASLRLQFSDPFTRQVPQDCTLSVGDGFTIAPGASLNVADRRIDNLVNDGTTVHQIVWDYAADGVADYSDVFMKAYGFVLGLELPGLFTGSTGIQFLTRPGSPTANPNPLLTSGPVEEVTALTSASSPRTSGPVEEVATLTGASPLRTSGPVEEVLTDGDYFGEIYGRVPGRAHTEPSGLQLLVDSAPQGAIRPNVNLIPAGRGVGNQGIVADQGNRPKAQIATYLGAYPLPEPGRLVRVSGVDAASVAATDLLEIPAGYECVITGATARAESGTPTIPASAGIGTNGTQDNIFGSQQLMGLLGAPQAYELVVGGAMAVATAGDTIRFGVDVAANAAQTLEITLFGYLRTT